MSFKQLSDPRYIVGASENTKQTQSTVLLSLIRAFITQLRNMLNTFEQQINNNV